MATLKGVALQHLQTVHTRHVWVQGHTRRPTGAEAQSSCRTHGPSHPWGPLSSLAHAHLPSTALSPPTFPFPGPAAESRVKDTGSPSLLPLRCPLSPLPPGEGPSALTSSSAGGSHHCDTNTQASG